MANNDTYSTNNDRNVVQRSWLPLLLLPVFFALGWLGRNVSANNGNGCSTNNRSTSFYTK